tara:strand:- start:698 stop:2341 length:1644 start_codon:yes stop_codon:yes gene_type:complete
MALGILVLITALTISAVAIYYSIAGLVAIFAAAAIPIIVMGTALEIGKLVTAVWLHRYWQQATWWLKTYLTTAVVVLMFITSMGIFGFLSKAHIEQTSASEESVAQVEQIDKEIGRYNGLIARAEEKINKIQNVGTGADQNIQAQIDKEQERIDTAYDRVQPAIDATNKQLAEDIKLYTSQIETTDANLLTLKQLSAIDTKDRDAVKLLQQLVGARPDGAYGSGTARAVKEYKQNLLTEKQELIQKIELLKKTANDEIKRLRNRAETEIDDSNSLITRLRSQLGKDTGVDIEAEIEAQTQKINNANIELDKLTQEKFAIEAEYRKLEAEVGPIKYIAEFVYGEAADKNMLEEAVRWVIITIIFVFDPLAVLLLIASQYTFQYHKNNRFNFKHYEDLRAQKIMEDQKEANEEEENNTEPADDQQEDAETLRDREDKESMEGETSNDQPSVEVEQEEQLVEKKDTESSVGLKRLTEEELALLDQTDEWKAAKTEWKIDNPDEQIKTYKQWYLDGKIEQLPWEPYLKKKKYITKEGDTQVRLSSKDTNQT